MGKGKSISAGLLLASLGIVLSMIAGGSSMGQQPAQSHAQQVESIFAPLASDKLPGLAVLVRKDEQTLFERGYGVRELRTHSIIDARTNFRLASVTKQFTAIAIMLLVHDKKLTYDETLTDIFPDFPAYGKGITVRNLLNHTGGLSDYEDLMDAFEKANGSTWSPLHQIQDDEVLSLLKKETKGKFVPGTEWSYSNSGYVILGLIVAKVSGKPFGDFLHERVFAPLKMDRTIAFQKGKNEVADRAFGHTKRGNKFEETDQSPTSATLGDGGIYSNLEDLAKWDDALRNNVLLTAEEMGPAFQPVKLAGDAKVALPDDATDSMRRKPKVSYGFGWFLDPWNGHDRMWHYGESIGFHTYVVRFTKNNLSIVILCNRTDVAPEELALRVAEVFFAN